MEGSGLIFIDEEFIGGGVEDGLNELDKEWWEVYMVRFGVKRDIVSGRMF